MVEQLQQRETEALRNEQLARVGQLAAGLAHELRNPLMPMKMLVQAAIERGPDAGLTGRSLHVLNDEITRLEKAIQEFLDFARPPAPDAVASAADSPEHGQLEDLRRLVRKLLARGDAGVYRELMQQVDRVILAEILAETEGNQQQAAERLGISRMTLRSKLRAVRGHGASDVAG